MPLTRDDPMPWGKHMGTPLGDITENYFKFIRAQDWINDDRNIDLRDWIDDALPEFKEEIPERSSSGGSDSGSTCNGCGEAIAWIKVDGKNTPIDLEPTILDGKRAFMHHFDTCTKSKKSVASEPYESLEEANREPEPGEDWGPDPEDLVPPTRDISRPDPEPAPDTSIPANCPF